MRNVLPNTAESRAESAYRHAPILRVSIAGGAAESNNRANNQVGCEGPRGSATLCPRRHLRRPRGIGCGNPSARAARPLHCSQTIGRKHVGC